MKERKAADEARRQAKAKADAEDAELEKQYYRSRPQRLALPPAVGDSAGANTHCLAGLQTGRKEIFARISKLAPTIRKA